MNRELKKRKKRFWVLCMAAVLLLYNILPMTAYAAEYKMKNTYVQSYDLSAGGSIVPGEVLYMQYGAYDLKYSTIEYRDENGNTLMTDTLDTDAQTFDGETYYKGIVKTYSEAGGDASKEALFKEWNIPDIYTSGGYATKVRLQAVMYIQSNIHYNLNADETNAATNPTTYLEGKGVASLEPASKTGHNFEGWYSDPGLTTKVESILNTQTGNVELYPKFTPATYNITYEANGADTMILYPATYTYGTGVPEGDFVTPAKTGNTFEGWYSDAGFTTKVTSISATHTGDVQLYAKFTPNSYTITYELDGGSNAAANPAGYTYGVGVTTFADASKTGYTFDGWYSDAAFTARVTSISAADMGNKTLYAKFTANASTPTPNPGVTETPTPAPAATETAAPSATETPAAMEKDDVPKTGGGMLGVVPVGVMLLSGIGLMIVGRRKSFTDEKQG